MFLWTVYLTWWQFAAFHTIDWETLVLLLRHSWTSFFIFRYSCKLAAHIITYNTQCIEFILLASLNHVELIYVKISNGICQWKSAINSRILMWRCTFLVMYYVHGARSACCISESSILVIMSTSTLLFHSFLFHRIAPVFCGSHEEDDLAKCTEWVMYIIQNPLLMHNYRLYLNWLGITDKEAAVIGELLKECKNLSKLQWAQLMLYELYCNLPSPNLLYCMKLKTRAL
jgi:hypothetical protein